MGVDDGLDKHAICREARINEMMLESTRSVFGGAKRKTKRFFRKQRNDTHTTQKTFSFN